MEVKIGGSEEKYWLGHGTTRRGTMVRKKKKCSKVAIILRRVYSTFWGFSNQKVNRAKAKNDFIDLLSVVSFLIGGGFFAMDKRTGKI